MWLIPAALENCEEISEWISFTDGKIGGFSYPRTNNLVSKRTLSLKGGTFSEALYFNAMLSPQIIEFVKDV